MVPLCQKKKSPGRDPRACFARDAHHAAALGAIFRNSPALCLCHSRLPRGEMQAVLVHETLPPVTLIKFSFSWLVTAAYWCLALC